MAATERSYHHSSGSYQFRFDTIPVLLNERFQQNPDDEFCVFLGYSGSDLPFSRSSITWRDLHDNSLKVAVGLLKLGLKPGDRIAIFGRSIPEWVYVLYASVRIKILSIPIPVSLVYSDKLAAFLREHRIKLLILDPGQDSMIVEKVSENVPNVKAMIGQKTSPDCEYPSKLMFLKSSSSSYLAVDEMLRSGLTVAAVDSVEQIQKSMDPDDPAVVYATSGSTGTPKLIVHSHFNMINIAGLYRSVVDEGNVVYNDSPFNWMGSMLFNGLTNNMCRVHLVAPTARQDEFVRLLFRIFRQEHVTSAMILTYILQDMRRLIKAGDETLADTLRFIMTGGEKIPEDMVADLSQWVTVTVGYACSEAPTLGYYFASDEKYRMDDGENMHLYRTIGHSEIKIVDDKGQCVPYGTTGLLMVRQITMIKEYLDAPEFTRNAITRGRWFGPGDMAVMHPSGRFQVLGRTTDLIIKGGVKIYPSKQEDMLLKYDKLAKAIVCSIPDDKFHEEICACVVPVTGCVVTVDELRAHCVQYQPAEMRVQLVPKHFLIMDHLPQLPNGKVDKRRLRAMFIELAATNSSQ